MSNQESMTAERYICAGCNVRGEWEHRCHSGNCQCVPCEEGRRVLAHWIEEEYRSRLSLEDRSLVVFVPAEVDRIFAEVDRLRQSLKTAREEGRKEERERTEVLLKKCRMEFKTSDPISYTFGWNRALDTMKVALEADAAAIRAEKEGKE